MKNQGEEAETAGNLRMSFRKEVTLKLEYGESTFR